MSPIPVGFLCHQSCREFYVPNPRGIFMSQIPEGFLCLQSQRDFYIFNPRGFYVPNPRGIFMSPIPEELLKVEICQKPSCQSNLKLLMIYLAKLHKQCSVLCPRTIPLSQRSRSHSGLKSQHFCRFLVSQEHNFGILIKGSHINFTKLVYLYVTVVKIITLL
jgi:hypothetical protein